MAYEPSVVFDTLDPITTGKIVANNVHLLTQEALEYIADEWLLGNRVEPTMAWLLSSRELAFVPVESIRYFGSDLSESGYVICTASQELEQYFLTGTYH